MAIIEREYRWPRHIYVRVSGELRNGSSGAAVEQWSFGVRVAELGPQNLAQPLGLPIDPSIDQTAQASYLTNKVVPAVRTLFADTRFSGWCYVTKISANMIAAGTTKVPRYEYQTSNEVLPGVTAGVTAIKGLASTGSGLVNHHPPQIALVGSLRTSVARGLAHSGRLYLPGVCTQLDTTWKLASGDAVDLASKLASFISGLQSAPSTDTHVLWPCVISPLGGLVGGTIRPITQVAIGDVFDTVVRRHHSLQEIKVTATPSLA